MPDTNTLVNLLSTNIDPVLAQQLFDEAIDLEKAFARKHWKYSELDGGRFAEVASRILYAADSQFPPNTKSVDDCLRYIENDSVAHHFPEPKAARNLAKSLRAIYNLRSQRGAVHVSNTYEANEIDSRYILESARWILSDILRIFVTTDRDVIAEAIRELSQFPHPLIREYGNISLVQSTTLSVSEEILVQLYFNEKGLKFSELLSNIPRSRSAIKNNLEKLSASNLRQIVLVNEFWLITDLGVAFIDSIITL